MQRKSGSHLSFVSARVMGQGRFAARIDPMNAYAPFIKRSLARFRTDAGGNVAAMFAITLVPFMSLFGSAVDYGRAMLAEGRLQAATDGALLANAKLIRQGAPMQQVSDAMLLSLRTISQNSGVTIAAGSPTLSSDK